MITVLNSLFITIQTQNDFMLIILSSILTAFIFYILFLLKFIAHIKNQEEINDQYRKKIIEQLNDE
jgi:hypothetical protein